jgi:hypothetical protein
LGVKINLDIEEVRKEMYNINTIKKLGEKFNCGRDFMSKFLLQYNLYEEFCKIHNKTPKTKKEYCVICGSDNQVNKYQGKPYCKKHWNHMVRYGEVIEKTIYDKNDYIFEDDIVKIVLRDRKQNINGYCIIDKDDYDKVKKYKWYKSYGYCKTKSIIKDNGIAIHNVIMDNLEHIDEIIYDHQDKDKLNNRKLNLRLVTDQENAMNMSKKITNTSGVTGVRQYNNDLDSKWEAGITYKYENIFLGRYLDFDEAVIARLEGEAKYFKEYSPNYNKETGTICLDYISYDSKIHKYIEMSLDGKVLREETLN